MQQTLRITSFRGPPPDFSSETKMLSTAMLVGPAPVSGSLVDVADDGLFAFSKRCSPDVRPLCDASLAMAVDDMTGIIQSAACRTGDAWANADQASKRHRAPVALLLFLLMPRHVHYHISRDLQIVKLHN